MLSFIGLIRVWMTSTSALMICGSLAVAVVLAVVCGILRLKRIQTLREQQKHQAQEWKTGIIP